MTATLITAAARKQLHAAGVTLAQWAHHHGYPEGDWGGDVCGCPDDRCVGTHHGVHEDCSCLPSQLADYRKTTS